MVEQILPCINGKHQLLRKIVIDFVEELTVDNDKNIYIRFKFADELKKYRSIFEKKTI